MALNRLSSFTTFSSTVLRQQGRGIHTSVTRVVKQSPRPTTTQCSITRLPFSENLKHETCTNCIRHSSGTPLSQQQEIQEQKLSENDEVSPKFINRNPRNLERMAIAYKDDGWGCSYPRKNYWHRLFVEQSNRHITAYIEHNNGHRVISASTKEWAIKKQLYALNDVSAAYNIGRVLAQRCLEAGISFVKWRVPEEVFSTEKIQMFLTAATEGGLIIHEPKTICDFTKPINYFPDMDHDKKK
ncbi:large ribosomal subunit protein uL18m-like [Ptychodera flava]|uniref:large ribosomal subunit protein uL18m-like n=1 Tax=Ptychodera flava TaxID=63121 RepID=UPI00396A4059